MANIEKQSTEARTNLELFIEKYFIEPKFQKKIMQGYINPILNFVNKGSSYSKMINSYDKLYNKINDSVLLNNFYSLFFVAKIAGINAVNVETYIKPNTSNKTETELYAADPPPKNMTTEELFRAFNLQPEKAIKYFESKGIKLSQGWKDAMLKSHQHAFTIANVTKLDLLYDVKQMLEKALKDGKPINEFKKEFRDLLQQHGWYDNPQDNTLDTNWRINLIVRQNSNDAYAAGRFLQSIDGQDRFPYIIFSIVLDKSTTSTCKYLGKKKIVMRLDDKLLKYFYPPRHYHCRTDALPINEKLLIRRGYTVTKGASIMKYKNAKGFRKLPNKIFSPDLKQYPNKLQKHYKQSMKK